MRTKKRTHLCQGAASRGQLLLKQMPGMDHIRPHLQCYPHIGRPRYGGEPHRVIEQGFGRADLDQQGRQSSEIGIDWRRQRRPWVGTVRYAATSSVK